MKRKTTLKHQEKQQYKYGRKGHLDRNTLQERGQTREINIPVIGGNIQE